MLDIFLYVIVISYIDYMDSPCCNLNFIFTIDFFIILGSLSTLVEICFDNHVFGTYYIMFYGAIFRVWSLELCLALAYRCIHY